MRHDPFYQRTDIGIDEAIAMVTRAITEASPAPWSITDQGTGYPNTVEDAFGCLVCVGADDADDHATEQAEHD